MAINLSRSFAKPCDILCDLTVDDVAISQGTVGLERDGSVFLVFDGQKPSIKYNGEGYTCDYLLIKSPSWHTVEDIRAEAEVVAVCQNPKGGQVWMSLLLRTNGAASKSKALVNSFVPYALKERAVRVNLGQSWSLTQMIPPDPAYYSYKGKSPDGRDNVQWVVFRSAGNMDPNDFALLTKLTGSVPTKMVTRTQEVFFNDTRHISGVPDGKAYMRCKRVKKQGETAPRITPAKGLQDAAAKKESDATKKPDYSGPLGFLFYAYWRAATYIDRVGAGSVLDTIVFILAILGGLYGAYSISQSEKGLSLARTAQSGAKNLLGFWNGLLDRIIAVVPILGNVFGFFKYKGQL